MFSYHFVGILCHKIAARRVTKDEVSVPCPIFPAFLNVNKCLYVPPAIVCGFMQIHTHTLATGK